MSKVGTPPPHNLDKPSGLLVSNNNNNNKNNNNNSKLVSILAQSNASVFFEFTGYLCICGAILNIYKGIILVLRNRLFDNFLFLFLFLFYLVSSIPELT